MEGRETGAHPIHTKRGEPLPVAILGAGPIGLTAALHLMARGERAVIFEAGERPGAAIRKWGHVRMFPPWSQLMDPLARDALEATGWSPPDPDGVPTGQEFLESYLEPLAELPAVQAALRLGHEVTGVGREVADKVRGDPRAASAFELVVERRRGSAGGSLKALGLSIHRRAKAVLDASGAFHQPNPLGSNGLPAEGEEDAGEQVFYGIPNPTSEDHLRYAGKRVAVVGNGDTALNALLALDAVAREEPATRLTWVVRGEPIAAPEEAHAGHALPERWRLRQRAWDIVNGGRAELVRRFRVRALRWVGSTVLLQDGDREIGPFERVVAATGSRPDLGMLRELRLTLDPRLECPSRLAPLIDPDIHTCETVRAHGYEELRHPEPGFFVVGMKSYGRSPGFLLSTGYRQIQSVVSALVGDMAGAQVEPASNHTAGACSASTAQSASDGGTCCG